MGVIEIISVVINAFLVLRLITSVVMCVYGCKWRKGLIATTSLYIGIFLGLLLLAFLMEVSSLEMEINLLISAVVPIVFTIMAYKCIWLNHFLTGFLVFNKLSFMVIFRLMSERVIDIDLKYIIAIPIIIGIIAGIIISVKFINYAVLFCIVYIGTVDLVLSISEMINKALFVATSDLGFLFDPEDILLKLVGVDVPSVIEVIFIIVVGIISFILQKKLLDRQGISLSSYVVDDRKKDLL